MPKKDAFKIHKGWIEVICGPMFSGKSEELLRKLNRLKYAKIKHIIFKPTIDKRTSAKITTRNGLQMKAIEIHNSFEIINHINKIKIKPQVIAIDEAQFLDEALSDVCQYLADNGYNVYVAGLDTDFRGEPFSAIAKVMPYAEKVIKLTAICTICGAPATRTQRIVNGKPAQYDDSIVVIDDNKYHEARCRKHHQVLNRPKKF